MYKTHKFGDGLNELPHKYSKKEKQMYKYFPNVMRCGIFGASNCGKTHLLIKILTDRKYGLCFSNIYIYSHTLHQDKYKYLEEYVQSLNKELDLWKYKIGFYPITTYNDLIAVEEIPRNSVVIFDDINTRKITKVEDFFTRGRHQNLHCFYLCQTFTRVPRQMVRDNFNFVILFKMNNSNLKHVFSNFCVDTDMTMRDFQECCNYAWKDRYGFLAINLEKDKCDGKYTINFNRKIKFN